MSNIVQLRALKRPMPPADLLTIEAMMAGLNFVAAPDVERWMRATFIEPGGPLHNGEHAHLEQASIGVLWTAEPNSRQMRTIAGQAELMPPGGTKGKWAKARELQQLIGWFGHVPDFLITLYAPYAGECDDASFCALVEHELLHCAQARDEFGAPKFRKSDGMPIFAMRGHDVEEFVSIVRRYGAKAAGVEEMIEAANERPLLSPGHIAQACGTCMGKAA